MKHFGWTVLILELLGCAFAIYAGAFSLGQENSGLNVIGIAVAAVGVVYAGLTLVLGSRSD